MKKLFLSILIVLIQMSFYFTGYYAGYQDAINQSTSCVIAKTANNTFKTCKTSIYYVQSKKDLNKLGKILEKRNGRIIVEIINGTAKDNKGNGLDTAGYYIYYNPQKFKKGDRVQTVLVYNPETNHTDDVSCRIDTKLKERREIK